MAIFYDDSFPFAELRKTMPGILFQSSGKLLGEPETEKKKEHDQKPEAKMAENDQVVEQMRLHDQVTDEALKLAREVSSSLMKPGDGGSIS